MRMRSYVSVLLVISLIGLTAPGVYGASLFESFWRQAQEEAGKLEGVIIGGSVFYATSPYIDVDEDIVPLPLIIAEYERFYVDGSKLGFFLLKEEALKVSTVLSPRLQGYEADDSQVLNGMEDRDWSLDGGLRLEWKNDLCVLSVTALADLLSNHQGQEVRAVVSREFLEGFLTPRLGLSWQSKDLVDYYYGVTGTEATVNRPVYQPDSVLNGILGLRIAYPLGDHWALLGDVGVEFYGSEIRDSSIVDADEQVTYLLGAVYRF